MATPTPVGLYGSNVAQNLLRNCAAELIGTFALLYVGAAVAVEAALKLPIAGPPVGSLGVALAFGLTLAVMVYVIGHISGCHLNPAVTVALMATKKFPIKYGLCYIVGQLLASQVAGRAVWYSFGRNAVSERALPITIPSPSTTHFGATFLEFLGPLFLVLVIMAVSTDDRVEKAAAGLAVGGMLFLDVLFTGPLTGGAINPGRALEFLSFTGWNNGYLAYIIPELLGGVTGAFVYQFLAKAKPPQEAEADSQD